MKKQVLILSLCLAVTASSALAATSPVKAAKKTESNVVEVSQQTPALTAEQVKRKEFEARMNKERELLYNNLNFTAEQKAKAEALHVKAKAAGEPLMIKARAEKAKLTELKLAKASEAEILKQKAAVKAAKKEVRKHMKASKKEFEAILTKEQLAKLEVIKESKKAEMKEFRKCQCKNPGHGHDNTFGSKPCPVSEPCSNPTNKDFPLKTPCECK